MDPREADMNAPSLGGRSAEAIRREIDRTRCRLDSTVDELQTRLSPRYIADQAVCAMKEKARTMRQSMINTIKDHPIPSAMMGAGAACLVACAVRDRVHRKPTSEDARIRSETAAYQQGFISGHEVGMTPSSHRLQGIPAYGAAREYCDIDGGSESHGKLGHAAEQVRHRVADVRHRVADTASSIGHRVSDAASTVSHRVSDTAHSVAHRTKESARYASAKARDTFFDHPIAIGLAAVGLGIAAGLAIPASRREDRWFGSTRDELLRKAREAGEDTLDRGKSVAKSAAECVKEEAKSQLGTGSSKATSTPTAGPSTASSGTTRYSAQSISRDGERGGRTNESSRSTGVDSASSDRRQNQPSSSSAQGGSAPASGRATPRT